MGATIVDLVITDRFHRSKLIVPALMPFSAVYYGAKSHITKLRYGVLLQEVKIGVMKYQTKLIHHIQDKSKYCRN